MTNSSQRLLDWLDDLCVRFIVNLPHEELQSVERICFQIEEAQWFYEDFVRPLDPSLPSMNLRIFSQRMFQHCPLFAGFTELHRAGAYEQFMQYKTRVPVRGAIMLNQEMTHAVLVKGWKKSAKWSFPRGKINKDEMDLDCAIREVYEETGYDLKQAGLARPESEMKGISVNMHQQNMLLYIFRGVPMDTHFEPRTRKEISKIDWYKLTDLPNIKNRKQSQYMEEQESFKNSNFYMVGPFLPQLRAWIKLQRNLDRASMPSATHLNVVSNVIAMTDTEGDVGETTADEAILPDDNAHFSNTVANVGRSHRPSDAFPEVFSQVQSGQLADPAAELKRLLSVGPANSSSPASTGHHFAEQIAPASNFSRAGASNPILPNTTLKAVTGHIMPSSQPIPRQHIQSSYTNPAQPSSALLLQYQQDSHSSENRHLDSFPRHQNSFPTSFSPSLVLPQSHPLNHPVFANTPTDDSSLPRHPFIQVPQVLQQSRIPATQGPAVPEASKLPPPKLTTHTLNLLNSFKLNEKPAITSPQEIVMPPRNSEAPPRVQQPRSEQTSNILSPQLHVQCLTRSAPSPPAFQSPPLAANFQPIQPQPRSAHQDSLLNLFKSPSVVAASPSPESPFALPAELSAYPTTPWYPGSKFAAITPASISDLSTVSRLAQEVGLHTSTSGITSATVRGPVNAPDFETVKKNTQINLRNSSRGPSPISLKQKAFAPQHIGKRVNTLTRDIGNAACRLSVPSLVTRTTSEFKPKILKRPGQQQATEAIKLPTTSIELASFQQSAPISPAISDAHTQGLLYLLKGQEVSATRPTESPMASRSPGPAIGTGSDQQSSAPNDQKNTLLSLFGKTSMATGVSNPRVPSPFASLSAVSQSPQSRNPMPPSRSPGLPTPPKKTMTGLVSPISPLPGKNNIAGSPANMLSRSRISSIGESIAPLPSSQALDATALANHAAFSGLESSGLIPQKADVAANGNHTTNVPNLILDKGKAKVGTMNSGPSDGKSPVDKTFLLGFLNDFAKKAR